jgi:hypothetical protein
LGGVRGREIALEDRLRCRQLIEEAVGSGARLWKACEVIGITVRSYQRWGKDIHKGDGRHAARWKPANRLSEEEIAGILAVATSVRFRDLAVSQIVPILAEEGLYAASESSFYRVLRREKLLKHREPSRGRRHSRPEEYKASGPNQVWSWDITYLRGPIRGQFYYLYMVVDIWSRMIHLYLSRELVPICITIFWKSLALTRATAGVLTHRIPDRTILLKAVTLSIAAQLYTFSVRNTVASLSGIGVLDFSVGCV